MTYLKLSLLFLVLFIFSTQFGYSETWIKSFGGPQWEQGYSIIPTSDNGVLVCGETASLGAMNLDWFLLRLDHAGNIIWTKTYGGTGFDEAPFGLAQTQSGNFIVAGKTDSFGANGQDIWVISLDQNGNILWQKRYDKGIVSDEAYAIIPTSDEGLLIIGDTTSNRGNDFDAWLLKLDKNGQIMWQKKYGDIFNNHAFAASITYDGYYVAGATVSQENSSYDLWVLKLDFLGNIVWQQSLGGSANDFGRAIITLSNGCLVAGGTYSFGAGKEDAWIMRLGTTGNIVWQHTFGGRSNDVANSITNVGNNFLIGGSTSSFGKGLDDAWLIMLSPSGDIIWEKTYGGILREKAIAVASNNNNLFFTGNTSSAGAGSYDMVVAKTDLSGSATGELEITLSNATVNTPLFLQNNTNFSPYVTTAIVANTTALSALNFTNDTSHNITLSIKINDETCNNSALAGKAVFASPQQLDCTGVAACTFQYPPESHINVSAIPLEGYVFTGWEDEQGVCNNRPSCTFTLTNNTNLIAKFKKIAPLPPIDGEYIFFNPVRRASCEQPIGVGLAAEGQPYVDLNVLTPNFNKAVDLYFAFMAPDLSADTIYLVTPNGIKTLAEGLIPWKSNIKESIHEKPFGESHIPNHPEISGIEIPNGTYHIFLLITPAGKQLTQGYTLYQTTFTVQ